MPDIFYLISRWWKQILVTMVLSIGTVSAIVFFLPEKYLSVATALPTNPALADKTSVFNENIQIPSPNLGTEAELDIIVGTGQLDTVYLAVAKMFNLWDHYRTEEKGDPAVYKAMYLLRQNTNVSKSGYGELKVKVWDTDPNLAPQLANAITEQLNLIHQELQNENNKAILNKLRSVLEKDSLSAQRQQYEKLAAQYQLIVDTKPSALVIVERARPAAWPDKPKRALLITGTAVLSFFFGLLIALVLERRKKKV
jgi:uncharacterized protein involved in exopolysaccharide biosynthesis